MLDHKIRIISDKHVTARKTGNFNSIPLSRKKNVITSICCGYTFEGLLRRIEVDNCSLLSLFLARQLRIITWGYRADVFNGFKKLLNKQK